MKRLLLNIWFRLLRKAYYIGFLQEDDMHLSDEERHRRTRWMRLPNYKGGWFADPFILSDNGVNLELLAEEYHYKTQKGILSLLKVKREGDEYTLVETTSILELPTHLSFPNFIEYNNKVYVYPENYESGGLYIYEFDRTRNRLINPVLLVEAPLIDSAITYFEDSYYLFGTINDGSGLDTTKKVEVYKSPGLFGKYEHIQTIENNNREERGAGAIFIDKDGNIIRPVQCCNKSYGESLKLKKLIFGENVEEHEIAHYCPDHNSRMSLCIHTFNKLGTTIVVDGKEYLHPFMARTICPFIFKIIKLIR